MAEGPYVHGFDEVEQRRLIAQADYWRDSLILPGLPYRPGELLLEIGCAAGAALGVIGTATGASLAGIDLEARQITFAREHLESLGLGEADLRVGDAHALPWADDSVDHVFVMWLLEHLADPRPVLAEALRVVRSGGTITLTETDYDSFTIHPTTDDYEYLRRSQHDLFARCGNPLIGRMLGALLCAAGFSDVRSAPVGFHFFAGDAALRRHVDYVAEFLPGEITQMVSVLGSDGSRLMRGLSDLRAVADHPEGAMTQLVYRATGVSP